MNRKSSAFYIILFYFTNLHFNLEYTVIRRRKISHNSIKMTTIQAESIHDKMLHVSVFSNLYIARYSYRKQVVFILFKRKAFYFKKRSNI